MIFNQEFVEKLQRINFDAKLRQSCYFVEKSPIQENVMEFYQEGNTARAHIT